MKHQSGNDRAARDPRGPTLFLGSEAVGELTAISMCPGYIYEVAAEGEIRMFEPGSLRCSFWFEPHDIGRWDHGPAGLQPPALWAARLTDWPDKGQVFDLRMTGEWRILKVSSGDRCTRVMIEIKCERPAIAGRRGGGKDKEIDMSGRIAILGKDLLQVLKEQGVVPAACVRAVIDIRSDDLVTIYTESKNASPLIGIDWANVEAELCFLGGVIPDRHDMRLRVNETAQIDPDGKVGVTLRCENEDVDQKGKES